MRVTCEVSTKDRYEVLSQCLLSLALQTTKDFDLLVFDDSDHPPSDANELVSKFSSYGEVFQLLQEYKIPWDFKYGQKRGQHFNHQAAQEIAKTDLIWRVDDDQIAEPNVLENLLSSVRDDVGAVGGLVLPPHPSQLPGNAANLIADLDLPNVQWFRHPAHRVFDVEHLHSTFLYRKGIEQYNLSLSPAAHREETLFTYGIARKGYRVLVNTGAVTWHFPSPRGGIRSYSDPGFWNHDENVFCQQLLDWGAVKPRPEKIIVLDAGRGDHLIVKSLLPKIKAKYPDVILATCFPDIFNGEVEQITINEARKNLGHLDRHSIYSWCIDHNWKGNLVEAFEKMYQL